MSEIAIQTRDGLCRGYLYRPDGEGRWPGVLMYMDGPGMRPAVQEVAQRLAGAGYVVLLPDFFYRSGPYEPVDPKKIFTDPDLLKQHMEKFASPATPERMMSDTGYFLDYLESCPAVTPGPIGVAGYCMGGRLALIAAGTYPDRIAAAAAFHPGGVIGEAPTSPNKLAPKMKAKIYVAGAIEDRNFTEEHKQALIDALSEAGVDHKVETYPAKHGWVLRDTATHDVAAAERHWDALVALLDGVLKT